MKNKKRMEFIGNRISSLRIEKGITQEELAELSKVNLRTIQRIEKNETTPRNSTLELICEVLKISTSDLIKENSDDNNIVTIITHYFFLIVFNIALMGIIGFLTLDQNANINSRFGGVITSFFLPICIVFFTSKMSNGERLLKYGTGYIAYFIMCLILIGFGKAWITGIYSMLFPCLIISILTLFYGDRLLPKD